MITTKVFLQSFHCLFVLLCFCKASISYLRQWKLLLHWNCYCIETAIALKLHYHCIAHRTLHIAHRQSNLLLSVYFKANHFTNQFYRLIDFIMLRINKYQISLWFVMRFFFLYSLLFSVSLRCCDLRNCFIMITSV